MKFEFNSQTHLIFGRNEINRIGEICIGIGKKPMLVTTKGRLNNSGIIEKVSGLIEKAGIKLVIFDKAEPNPTTDSINKGGKLAKNERVDFIIGLGGGSAIDTGKAISVLVKSEIDDIWSYLPGKNHAKIEVRDSIPNVAIPTTSGTGSEVNMYFVVTNPRTNEKPGVGARCLSPKAAIVDPELMKSMPKLVTASTGMDAFYHSMEAYIANNSSPISDIFALRSIDLISRNILSAFNKGNDLIARENMALGSTFAGFAINTAGTVLLHAIGHTISGLTNAPHGVALSAISDAFIHLAYPKVPDKFNDILNIFGADTRNLLISEARDLAVSTVKTLKHELEMDVSVKDLGITKKNIQQITADAYATMSGCIELNPFDVKPSHIEDILKMSLND